MPVIPGSGGGGVGGGSNNLCDVSPSDQIGTLDNILNRLQAVEAALSALLGTNVEALQLSDISNDLGWIYNVTYMGEEGWTQTPSGTLIPPSGWAGLSSIIDQAQGWTVGGSGFANILSRYTTYGDIASGGSTYLHPTSTQSWLVSKGDTGLTDGTVYGGAGAWVTSIESNYLVTLYADLIDGSSPPSSGDVTIRMYYNNVGSSGGGFFDIDSKVWGTSGTSNALHGISFVKIAASVAQGIHFRILNDTDGDIQVNWLQATFVKI